MSTENETTQTIKCAKLNFTHNNNKFKCCTSRNRIKHAFTRTNIIKLKCQAVQEEKAFRVFLYTENKKVPG